MSVSEPSTVVLETRLSSPRVGGVPALNAQDLDVWVDGPVGDALVAELRSIATLEREGGEVRFGGTARQIVFQNDVWGLWQRASEVDSPSPNARALHELSGRLVSSLALPRPGPRGAGDHPPPVVASVLQGYELAESELQITQHELAFGGRRVFHLAVAGPERAQRALYSTLVALDPDGVPYETEVVGDLEMLEFAGSTLIDARVFELRRDEIGERQPALGLGEVNEVARVPGLGSNHSLAVIVPPRPLSDLPCRSCHRDETMMSLPRGDYDVGDRIPGVLDFARRNSPLNDDK